MSKVQNATFEVLKNLINEEMTLADYGEVANIIQEDFENEWINRIELGVLTQLFYKKTLDLICECDVDKGDLTNDKSKKI